MNELLNLHKGYRIKNKKGFTLVELIVVIVIIAILIAALTPAIMGAIDRASKSSDEIDARAIYMAANAAAAVLVLDPNVDRNTAIRAEIVGNIRTGLTVDLYYHGIMCTGVQITGGGRTNSSVGSIIGSVGGGAVMVGSYEHR